MIPNDRTSKEQRLGVGFEVEKGNEVPARDIFWGIIVVMLMLVGTTLYFLTFAK